jgi:hypothetical protein
MIFAVSFEIIIQRAVDNESCHTMKNTLIITVLSNRSRKNKLHNNKKESLFKLGKKIYIHVNKCGHLIKMFFLLRQPILTFQMHILE